MIGIDIMTLMMINICSFLLAKISNEKADE